jgi:nicotinate-nucleotide adenylyltransferase
MRIALFGGSFDPPHLGHVLAAVWAVSAGGADAVWVLPVAKHAWNKPLSPWDQRWTLCQAAFAPFPFVRLCDDERENPGGYTFNLVERLMTQHPGHQWALLGGTDTKCDLPRWHRGEELAQLVDIIAVPRRGFDDTHAAGLPAISSTLVRTRCAQGETLEGLVPTAVADLIATHHWYQNQA